MAKFLTRLLGTAIAALFASYVLDDVHIDGFLTAFVVAIVLGLLNAFIKPILVFLTLPVTIFTLGLFLLVINILMIIWTDHLVSGFEVHGWWPALLFSIIVSVIATLLEKLFDTSK